MHLCMTCMHDDDSTSISRVQCFKHVYFLSEKLKIFRSFYCMLSTKVGFLLTIV